MASDDHEQQTRSAADIDRVVDAAFAHHEAGELDQRRRSIASRWKLTRSMPRRCTFSGSSPISRDSSRRRSS